MYGIDINLVRHIGNRCAREVNCVRLFPDLTGVLRWSSYLSEGWENEPTDCHSMHIIILYDGSQRSISDQVCHWLPNKP